jgi:hypothetical protein
MLRYPNRKLRSYLVGKIFLLNQGHLEDNILDDVKELSY